MLAIQYALFLRFLRLRVWIAAVVLPAIIALLLTLGVGAGAGSPAVRGASAVLFWLDWALPCLALLFLLTSSGEGRRDLLLLGPGGWPGVLLGRFLGAIAIFGGCHLLLATVLFSSLAVAGGGPGGRVDREPAGRFLGIPGSGGRSADALLRPWPAGRLDPAWRSEVEAARSWSFVFTALPAREALTGQVRALIARVLTEESEGRRWQDLARARSVPADVGFLTADGKTKLIARIELGDSSQAEIAIPAGAVDTAGRLVVVISRVEEEAGELGGVKWGPRFFWFDSGGNDPFSARDLRLAVGEISFRENVLRASIAPIGGLLFACALGVAASALFSTGIAFGASLALFLISISKEFLAAILGSLERRSALDLLSDPSAHSHHLQHAPTWFDRALEVFLRAAMDVLPDFGSFHAGRFLGAGEAVPPGAIGRSIALGACTAAVFLAAALIFPGRKENRA